MKKDFMITRNLLIIDDEENMLHMLRALLSSSGYQIEIALGGKTGIEKLTAQTFDFVLCDVRMPEVDGLQVLESMKDLGYSPTVIMMSAFGTFDTAISAMKAGAYDFISKPFKKDEVLLALKKAEERECLRKENIRLKRTIAEATGVKGFDALIRKSALMETQIDLAQKVAGYNTTVLITGESGTGKELLARGIHANSERHIKPFYAINCGSIPAELIESELFGFVKGSFTGADRNHAGLFEAADHSTLFLDEIGELPVAVQVKLLRVLQESEIKPIGSNKTKKVDVRIIAATSRVLEDEVKQNRFREDLYYRLNVVAIKMPSLLERKDDIPILCNHFVQKYNELMSKQIQGVSSGALKFLLNYSWPGNVRELENVIERAMVLTDEGLIVGSSLPEHLLASTKVKQEANFGGSLKSAQKKLESEMISSALKRLDGNKSAAAKELEISYPSLLSKIKEYKIC